MQSPEPKRHTRLYVLLAWIGYGLLLFGYRHLDHLARHVPVPALVPFLEEMTGAGAGIVLFFPFVPFVRRFPLGRASWWRNLPLHVVAMLAVSFAHTWMLAHSRALLFPLFHLGPYDYGDMRVRYFMELANDAASYGILVMMVQGYDALRKARQNEITQAELRAELARAE